MPKQSPLLGMRNHHDARSLGFALLCLVSLVGALVFGRSGMSRALGLVWVSVNLLLCFVANIINHNHCHTPIFRARYANRCFELLLNLCKGYTTASVVMTHNWNHHRYTGGDNDWARASLAKASEQKSVARLLTYLFRASAEMRRSGRDYRRKQVPRAFRIRFWREQLTLLTFVGAGLAFNPLAMTLFVILPWAGAAFGLLSVNFFQHDSCDPASEWQHSRNFLGRFENWILFNNGYHTAHHLFPSLHWSELARAHQNIPAGAIASEFNAPSLAHYLSKNYFRLPTTGRSLPSS